MAQPPAGAERTQTAAEASACRSGPAPNEPGLKGTALPSFQPYKWADGLLAVPIQSSGQVPDFGHIHRPASSRGDWFEPPAGVNPRYQIDATRPRFTIVGSALVANEGERVEKVGMRTGWTYGYVINKCYDSPYTILLPSGAQFTRTIKCTVKTSAASTRGDSGGPYFRIVGDATAVNTQVQLLGITYSGNSSGHYSTFSPWDGLEKELGPLTVAP